MDLDPDRGELFRIHVGPGARAKEHDVPERLALAGDVGRQCSMVDDQDRRIAHNRRNLRGRDIGLPVDHQFELGRPVQAIRDIGKRRIGIDKDCFHMNIRLPGGLTQGDLPPQPS